MLLNKEILALLHLVDDPDNEVFETVASRLLHYGTEIIPNLEQLWETTEDSEVQHRIETLIHRALFSDLQKEFKDWSSASNPQLLKGAILIAKYRFPEMNLAAVSSLFEQIKRNVWLELSYYLTPLEQINVINSILYNYYKLQGREITGRDPNLFFLNHVLESKKGNAFSIGVIYLAICESLDIPIFAINLPRQFILAFFDSLFHFYTPESNPVQTIQFYIDPVNGMVYTQNDVNVYLQKMKEQSRDQYFQPLNNKEIIYKMLEELALTYEYNKEEDKSEEIKQLMTILKEKRD